MTTVRDVAEKAGVSVSTVSRALTMPHLVNATTRARVVAIANEMGYQPNSAARGLRSGVTNNIGLLIPDIENPYFSAVTKGVQERARRASYAVFAADSDEDTELEIELMSSLAKQVDGLILTSPRASDDRILEAVGGKPTIVLNRQVRGLESILIDNASGVAQVLDHLQALGHTRIAYAAGPVGSWSGAERLAEVRRQAQVRTGVEIIELGAFRPVMSAGYQAVDLALASGATALFLYNDLTAIGALERLRQRGVAAPENMSVVGFDDVSFAQMTHPTLTTVTIPLRRLGKLGVDALITHLADNHTTPTSRVPVPVEIRIRQSTAPPAGSAQAVSTSTDTSVKTKAQA